MTIEKKNEKKKKEKKMRYSKKEKNKYLNDTINTIRMYIVQSILFYTMRKKSHITKKIHRIKINLKSVQRITPWP